MSYLVESLQKVELFVNVSSGMRQPEKDTAKCWHEYADIERHANRLTVLSQWLSHGNDEGKTKSY
jgi:uncharacterized protein YifE (UPF0438 family)